MGVSRTRISHGGILTRVESTEEDRRVAKLATALLAEQGRGDLTVSPDQLVRWRQVAHAIPVEGENRGGRSQHTRYLAEAPAVAAAIARSLHDSRNLDDAVLNVYGEAVGYNEGPPPDFQGVRAALVRHLERSRDAAAQAWRYRGKARSEVPRRLRMPFDGSRRASSYVVSDAVLSALLGVSDEHDDAVVEYAVGEFVPEVAEAVPANELRQRLPRAMGSMSLAALRRAANSAEPTEFARRCRQMAVLHEYCEALLQVVQLTTGGRAALSPPLDALATLSGATSRIPAPRGIRVVILAISAYAHAADQPSQRAIREYAIAAEPHVDAMRASAEIAKTLPAHLRPALAPGSGPIFLSQLPRVDREAVHETVRSWIEAHPWADDAASRSQAAAQAELKDSTQ